MPDVATELPACLRPRTRLLKQPLGRPMVGQPKSSPSRRRGGATDARASERWRAVVSLGVLRRASSWGASGAQQLRCHATVGDLNSLIGLDASEAPRRPRAKRPRDASSVARGLKGIVCKFTTAQSAALCAAYASYPFDTVRRRLQADAQRPLGERRYKGNLDCLKKIYRVEGVRALFRGAGYNALRTITSALALVAYGELKKRKRA